MNPLLTPLIILITWSMVMWGWMYATRIPALLKMKMRLDPEAQRGVQMSLLPANVRWKADNYNNLMEQPTVFYALLIALIIMNDSSMTSLTFAWIYVSLRIIHSLVQSLINEIRIRFAVFFASGGVLVILTIRALEILLVQKTVG